MASGDSEDKGQGSLATGFIVGGVVGAILGLLLAPKSGEEMRADLLEQSEALRARAEELAAKVRERVGPAVEGMRERIGPAVEGIRDRVSPAVEQMGSHLVAGSDVSEGDGGPGTEHAGEKGGAGKTEKA